LTHFLCLLPSAFPRRFLQKPVWPSRSPIDRSSKPMGGPTQGGYFACLRHLPDKKIFLPFDPCIDFSMPLSSSHASFGVDCVRHPLPDYFSPLVFTNGGSCSRRPLRFMVQELGAVVARRYKSQTLLSPTGYSLIYACLQNPLSAPALVFFRAPVFFLIDLALFSEHPRASYFDWKPFPSTAVMTHEQCPIPRLLRSDLGLHPEITPLCSRAAHGFRHHVLPPPR